MKKLKHTNNYGMFSLLPMNRNINSKHVQTMIKSIRKMGVIRPVVICKTNCVEGVTKTYIVDGQHLATALEREKLDIPYVEIDVENELDLVDKMAHMNNSSKSWQLMDYVNAYKTLIPDYHKLFKWKNLYDIEPLMLACIAYGDTINITGMSKIIKSGEFSITNKKAEQMCKDFNDLFIEIGRADRWIKHQFLGVFIRKYDSYDHRKSLSNIKKHLNTLKAMTNATDSYQYIAKNIIV